MLLRAWVCGVRSERRSTVANAGWTRLQSDRCGLWCRLRVWLRFALSGLNVRARALPTSGQLRLESDRRGLPPSFRIRLLDPADFRGVSDRSISAEILRAPLLVHFVSSERWEAESEWSVCARVAARCLAGASAFSSGCDASALPTEADRKLKHARLSIALLLSRSPA